ncbi:hypothetical protein [Sulfuriflexus mobilis]|uniref:hypothetical protein n=1 Tax=Sulfuriflexus mobilis TaxID=1811807 RepID=UPI000F8172F0|nr:hypothetical protein [Sulfuriflexus mobilis]
MDKHTLQGAVVRGIIKDEQVEPLLVFLNEDEQQTADTGTGEEQLRFVRSFGDIFITLGILFVAVSLSRFELQAYANLIPVAAFALTAEWLVRVRRLALPGIAILLSMLYFTSQVGDFQTQQHGLFTAGLMTAVAAAFYLRHKMPFSLLPIAAGIIGIVTFLLRIDLGELSIVLAGYGLAIFAVAMWFDIQDTARQTRLSDCAFWLHLLAAPLIVHGVMVSLLSPAGIEAPYREILTILFFIGFFLLALYVDRRALLVSSISYAIYAVIQLAEGHVIRLENITLFVFLLFGVFIVFFGTYWYRARSLIFAPIAKKSISAYVPRI